MAIDFALAYPDAVSVLIVVGSSLSGFPWSKSVPELSVAVSRTWRDAGASATKQLMLGSHWFQTVQEQPEVIRHLEQIVGDYSGWHWAHHDPVSEPHPSAYERLESISAPTLVVVGEHDHSDIHSVTRALTMRIPDVQMVLIPGVGHMLNMEAPEQLNRAVLEFLASLLDEQKETGP